MYRFENPIAVTKAFLPPIDEYKKAIEEIWESNWITNNGPIHNRLSVELRKYLKVENSTLFTNGHLALDSAIKSLNLKGEVITTPFTFASTTHAIVMNGLKPVFCDINLEDFTIDTSKIEELITEDTVAIIPVHVFGYPCNVEEINRIANKYGLKLIYDAAHVFGVEINGIGIGCFGDISMFSLHATKVYNSIEGGVLTYKNPELSERLDMVKNFGITGCETVEAVGLNAKMNEFQATMGLLNLNYLEDQISKRRKIFDVYRSELKEVEGILFLKDKQNVKHNYSYFPIIIDEKILNYTRDEIYERLKDYNIYTRKYFYPLVTDFDCYKGKFKDGNLKNAKYISERVITLPVYSDLKLEDAKNIIDILKHILRI